jgi:hypothetical protein
VTRDQVPLALPESRTGARQIVSLKPDVELIDFVGELDWRADHLDARKAQRDNILKISSDGRNASLAWSPLNLEPPTDLVSDLGSITLVRTSPLRERQNRRMTVDLSSSMCRMPSWARE